MLKGNLERKLLIHALKVSTSVYSTILLRNCCVHYSINTMSNILISGGTGLTGRALTAELLKKGYTVTILSRQQQPADYSAGVRYSYWNPGEGIIDKQIVEDADYLIHLAGAGVADKRWTEKRKREIKDSRVIPTKLLADTVKLHGAKLKAVIVASAIGWYGPDPVIPNPKPFTEEDPAYADFLGNTCLAWEQAADSFAMQGKRLVKLRTGIVLSREGGALKEFLKPLKWGIAAVMGSGRQVVSWIHISDLVRLYIQALENGKMEGVYNAVAPLPVSNKQLMTALGKKKKGNFFMPIHIPSFLLKIVLGEMSVEILKSTTVSCNKLHGEGFIFQYPSLESALGKLLEA